MGDEPTTDSTGLQHLEATLEAALDLTRSLAGDPVLARLLAAFRLMPADDRAVVVGAIEREVKARKLSLATEAASGQSMVPNPNARFYLRAHESSLDRNLLERDEMTIATVRGMRAATLIPAVPEIHASWREATREATQHVDAATRATVERLLHEVLGFLAAASAAEQGGDAAPPSAPTAPQKDARES
jgi:hypothetical protein